MARPYRRLTNDLNLYEWNAHDEREFKLFCEYVWKSDGGKLLVEFSFGKEIREKIKFIKEFARETGFKLKDLLTLFMEKGVFKLFQVVGWSMKALFELMKKGFEAYKNLQLAIAEFISDTGIVNWTKNELIQLDRFLKTHPKTKRVAGIAVAGMLVYIFLTMTFTGDFIDDFNIDSVFQSLSGNFSLYEFFGTPSGIRVLMLLVTGAITGLSFPWPGNNLIKFTVAIFVTIAKYFHKKLNKGDDLDQYANV